MANTFTSNFSGRKVDLLIFQGGVYAPGLDAPVAMSLGSSGQLTTGVQKALQRWVNLFMTRKGSIAGEPTLGTLFMSQLLQGSLQNDIILRQAFAVAVRNVQDYLLSHRTGTEPADEVISAVSLLSFSLDRTSLSLQIGFTTLAGTSRDVVVPVRITVL